MPPTPVPYPERPKGPLFKLLLAAALAVINGANRSIDGDRNESRAVALYSETDLMKIRSALDELNVYRHELIRKKRLRGLSVNEELKLVEFQEQARILADELSPIDSSKSDSIEELLALHGKPK